MRRPHLTTSKATRKYLTVGALTIAAVLGLCGCNPSAHETTTLRIAHPLNPTHPNHIALEFFAKNLSTRSNGKMNVELYPGGQLGNDRESLELLQIGSLDMAITSAAVVEGFVPDFKIFGLPYLFRDRAHRLDVLRSEPGEQLLLAGLPYRLRGMAYFDAGSRSFYTKDAIVDAPTDLMGKKIRVLGSPMAIRTVRALGASPTPIAWGELYTALQQGVVDAAENNPPSLLTSRHYEITPFFSLDEHSAIPDVLMMGQSSWNRLNAEQQKWVRASVREAARFQYELWANAETTSLETLEAAGVTIHRPDKTPFIDAVSPLYEAFAKETPELNRLVQQIRQP